MHSLYVAITLLFIIIYGCWLQETHYEDAERELEIKIDRISDSIKRKLKDG